MICPHCGNYLSGIAKICPMCGKALKKNQEDDRIDQQWKEKLQYTPPSYDPGPDRRPLIALIIVIVVLIVAGGTGAVLYSLKKNGPGPEENVQTYEDPAEGVQDPQGAQEPSQEQEQVPADSSEQTQQPPQDPEQTQQPAQDPEQTQQSGAGENPDAEKAGNSNRAKGAAAEPDSDLYYFRAQLEGEELELYDALYEISKADTETGEKEISMSVFPGSEEFANMLSKTRSFLHADHPELFYITGFHFQYWENPDEDGKYSITIKPDFVPPDHAQELEEMEKAADALLSEVDTSQPPAKIALQIHDRILELVQYDYDTYENAPDYDYAFTAYGALVANSSGEPNMAVCAGYASAYQYLLQKEGILALVVGGDAWSESDPGESHAWNLVEFDGDWYETDCTWDDNIHDSNEEEKEGIVAEALDDEYYRNTIEHYLFQVTTETIEDFDPGDDYTYESDNGWATFLVKCGRSRYTRDDVDETYDYATIYAPTAEGTKYSYNNIR